MFFLLGTDLPRRRRPVMTEALVLLMMAAYLAVLAIGAVDRDVAERVVDAMALSARDFQWWQAVTYQFAHDSPLLPGTEHPLWRLLHLGLNVMCLWVFGCVVEDRMGRPSFLIFALLGGAVAGLAHAMSSTAPVIGASGMVGALAGGFIILAPTCRVRILFVFILIRVFQVPALLVLGFWIAMDLAGWAGLTGSKVAYTAHLAGYAWGAITASLLLFTPAIRREHDDLIGVMRQRKRRREWRQTVERGASPHRKAHSDALTPPPFLHRVRAALRADDAETARTIWRTHADEHPDATLPMNDHLLLANHLHVDGDRAAAADAYRRWLTEYGDTKEATEVRLLLGALLTRSLGAPSEAVPLLQRVLEDSTDDRRTSFARALLKEASS